MHLFSFRGSPRNLLKVIGYDGQGARLFTKLGTPVLHLAEPVRACGDAISSAQLGSSTALPF